MGKIIANILVIAILIIIVVIAIRDIYKKRKSGCCCNSCIGCNFSESCNKQEKHKQ